MKLVNNDDVALTIDGNGAPIFLEPVRSRQIVLCIEHHKCGDLWTFEALFFFPKHIVMVINSPI